MIGIYAASSVQVGAPIVFALLLTAAQRAIGSSPNPTASGAAWRACR
jgi:hypothetical protein